MDCWETNKTKIDACISKLIPWCRKAKHRVTKVLRLSLDNTENLLRDNSLLKVIQLIRDPRGVINSQIHTGWFPFSDKSLEKLRNNAVTMCSRMLHDIESGKRLMHLFPNRVQIIHYEDLMTQSSLQNIYTTSSVWIFPKNTENMRTRLIRTQ